MDKARWANRLDGWSAEAEANKGTIDQREIGRSRHGKLRFVMEYESQPAPSQLENCWQG